MVGSGGDRSKEAVGIMALHEALRSICLHSEWTYSVFWTTRPRLRARGGKSCRVGDDNGSLFGAVWPGINSLNRCVFLPRTLMWEDGFCKGRVSDGFGKIDNGEDPVRKAFSKMSIQLYNYGEGLMGRVASDKCHKWVFKDPPPECEQLNISNYWQSSFDPIPPEWTDQFESGIQTIAVIQAGHGLLQLGSCKIIPEDLHFVLRMRHTFNSLAYQSGFSLSHLFSSTRDANFSVPLPSNQPQPSVPIQPPFPHFNWVDPSGLPSPFPEFSNSTQVGLPHLPYSSEAGIGGMAGNHEMDIRWIVDSNSEELNMSNPGTANTDQF
ncbi:hypothetical protein NMG60_11003401 [Bertholletia excelsa]